MALYDAAIDTTKEEVRYRDFSIWLDNGGEWDWAHENYRSFDKKGSGVGGLSPTLFKAIQEIDAWYDSQEEAA